MNQHMNLHHKDGIDDNTKVSPHPPHAKGIVKEKN